MIINIRKLPIILSLLAVGCQNTDESPIVPPEDLLKTEELIPVIIDLQVLESHYQRRYQQPNLYKTALDSASNSVFEKHNITEDRFERSYEFYGHDLPKMFQIYEAALDSLNARISLIQNGTTEQ